MLEAMDNTAGVIDNDVENNTDVKAIRELSQEKKGMMAWKVLVRSS